MYSAVLKTVVKTRSHFFIHLLLFFTLFFNIQITDISVFLKTFLLDDQNYILKKKPAYWLSSHLLG